jgi:hypothetical protein
VACPTSGLGSYPPKSTRNTRTSTCRGHAIGAGFPASSQRDLDRSAHPSLRPGENQTATCEFSPTSAVDGLGRDPYTPVHRRAANGVGGLLLHLLTIWRGLGLVFWAVFAVLFVCMLFFEK